MDPMGKADDVMSKLILRSEPGINKTPISKTKNYFFFFLMDGTKP